MERQEARILLEAQLAYYRTAWAAATKPEEIEQLERQIIKLGLDLEGL